MSYDPIKHDAHDRSLRDVLVPFINDSPTLEIVEHLDRTDRYANADLIVASTHYGMAYEVEWKTTLSGKPNYIMDPSLVRALDAREIETQRCIMIVTDLRTAQWWQHARDKHLDEGIGTMAHKLFLRISEFPPMEQMLR